MAASKVLSTRLGKIAKRIEKHGVDPHTGNQIISLTCNYALTGHPEGIRSGTIYEDSFLFLSQDTHVYPTNQTMNGIMKKVVGTLCDHTKTPTQKDSKKGKPGVNMNRTGRHNAEVITGTLCSSTRTDPQRTDLYRYMVKEGDMYVTRWACSAKNSKRENVSRAAVYPQLVKRTIGTKEVENFKWSVVKGQNPLKDVDENEYYADLAPKMEDDDPILWTGEIAYNQTHANKVGDIYNYLRTMLIPAVETYHKNHPERDVNDGKQQTSKETIDGQVHGRCDNYIKASKSLKDSAKDVHSNGPMSIRSNIASGPAGVNSAITRTSGSLNAARKIAESDTPTDDKNQRREEGILANIKSLKAIYAKRQMVPQRTFARFERVVKSRVSKEIKDFIDEEGEDLRMLATVANAYGLDNKVTYQLGPWGMLNYEYISRGWKESESFAIRQIAILNEEIDHMIKYSVLDNLHAVPAMILRLWMVRSVMPCNVTPQVEWFCLGFPSTPIQGGARNAVCPYDANQLYATNQVGELSYLVRLIDDGVGIVALPRLVTPKSASQFPGGAILVSGEGTDTTTLSPWYGVNKATGKTAGQVSREHMANDFTTWTSVYHNSEGRLIKANIKHAHQPGQIDPLIFFNCGVNDPGVELKLRFLDDNKEEIVLDLKHENAADLINLSMDSELNGYQEEIVKTLFTGQVWMPPPPILLGRSYSKLAFFQTGREKSITMLMPNEVEGYRSTNKKLNTNLITNNPAPPIVSDIKMPIPSATLDPNPPEDDGVKNKIYKNYACGIRYVKNTTWFARGRVLGGTLSPEMMEDHIMKWSYDDWGRIKAYLAQNNNFCSDPRQLTAMDVDPPETARSTAPEPPGPSAPKKKSDAQIQYDRLKNRLKKEFTEMTKTMDPISAKWFQDRRNNLIKKYIDGPHNDDMTLSDYMMNIHQYESSKEQGFMD